MEPWALDGGAGTFCPASAAVLSSQRREEAAAGLGGVGYITSAAAPPEPVPPKPCFQCGGQRRGGGDGLGPGTRPRR